MTKARDIADFKFEDIVDTGTEGTKVASGTTAQRGSTTGQIRFNSTTNLAEYYDGTAFKSIDAPPTVASVDVTEVDSQAGGNQTIVVTGTNFSSGGTVTFVGNSGTDFNASTTTFNNDTQVTAVAPKASFLNAQEPYKVKFSSSAGLSETSTTGLINVDTSPAWQTASGSLGSVAEDTAVNITVSATDADGDTVAYSVQSGSLPAGTSLNSSTGVISGDPTDVSSDTTSNFTLRATANSKTTDRAFSIIITNPILDGSTPTRANTSAEAIKTLTGTTTNGLYYIKPTGVSTAYQAYCNMNIGGGIILGAKISAGSSNYWHYSSNLWTTNNNRNLSQLNTTDDHAKLQPAQDFPTNYLYVTNDDMTRWCRFDLTSQTTGFHNIWSGNNTTFSVTGSTVGTHVSATNVETDHATFFDPTPSSNEPGGRNQLLTYYTPTWQRNHSAGSYGSSFGSSNGVRLGKINVNDVGPWGDVHHEARGLGIKAGDWSGQSSGSYAETSSSRMQMIFLR